MRIEQMFYGMIPSTGKIALEFTSGARKLITSRNVEFMKQLKPADNGRYFWLPTEDTVAYASVREVKDERPGKGGRTWIQVHVLLVGIHEYLGYNAQQTLQPYALPEVSEFPQEFAALSV